MKEYPMSITPQKKDIKSHKYGWYLGKWERR